jgi:hypothetical protein
MQFPSLSPSSTKKYSLESEIFRIQTVFASHRLETVYCQQKQKKPAIRQIVVSAGEFNSIEDQALLTDPERKQRLQTCIVFGEPSTTTLTLRTFGF